MASDKLDLVAASIVTSESMGLSSCRKTSSRLPLILQHGELCKYFIIYYNIIRIEIKYTINVIYLSHSKTSPLLLVEKLSSRKRPLVPKSFGYFSERQSTITYVLSSITEGKASVISEPEK